MAFSVCVFCSASESIGAPERAVARDLGETLARRGWQLVYGGGDIGLMGEVARAALAHGGHVTGVIPHRLADREIALEHVTELIRVETMRERKQLMDERADAFVVLPGGIGTLEELVEILTLKQLGYHERPVVLLDPTGFWAPLREQITRIVDRGLAPGELKESWADATDVTQAIAALDPTDFYEHTPEERERLEAG